MLKNHNYLQIQWKLQKKFKNNFLKKNIINYNIYKKLCLFNKKIVYLTKISILTKSIITSNYLICKILKIRKKKLSLILEEMINKFILNINLKTFNIIL